VVLRDLTLKRSRDTAPKPLEITRRTDDVDSKDLPSSSRLNDMIAIECHQPSDRLSA
jgi:hypothetical protein